jgi:hypothetical protein
MNIQQATKSYEAWLTGHVRVLKADLAAKHKLMAHDPFSFLRATFYRWMQLFPQLCPELAKAPRVLSVGDLHVENYGTWRDAEGRLVWGINDFDEAFPLPYTVDLVRLATSACLAVRLNHLSLDPALGRAAILDGYTAGLEEGGKPFVLAERYRWLREVVTGRLRDPTRFWEKLVAVPLVKRVPADALSLLKQAMPEANLAFRVSHRQAGLGSLGRDRFTAIAEWCGGKIAREVKALLPSACVWAGAKSKAEAIYYQEILRRSVRVADPFLGVRNGWVLRRLAPYCSRIELFQLPRGHDEQKLLRAMGREVANIHVGTSRAVNSVRRDLRRRKPAWLRKASKIMAEVTYKDWKDWQKWTH